MSFGFSIGDFIAISNLALNIYNSCKNPPAEFKSITSELNTLSTILEAIASQLSKHPLDERVAKELEMLSNQSREVFEDVKNILQKYGSLGQKKPRRLDRIRWAMKGPSDVSKRLLFHAGVLNYINTSLLRLSQDNFQQNLTKLLKNPTKASATSAENPSSSDPSSQPLILNQAPNFLPEYSKIQPQNLLVTDRETTTEVDKRLTRAENNYQHIKSTGSSCQINGNVGEPALWSCRPNAYFDVTAGGNSIQFNGNVSDPHIFLRSRN